MLTLGPLGFAAPWLLTALAILPILWWLLRAMPPAPRLVPFPAIRLLFGLEQTDETPHRTPWWLLLLRVVLAALVIIALAQPVLNPGAQLRGSGALLLVIDDDWAAAKNWPVRQAALNRLLTQAERDAKPVIVLTTAPAADGEPIAASKLVRAAEARRLVQGLQPKPWPADRAAAQQVLAGLDLAGSVNAVWLSNGLDDGAALALARTLQPMGALQVMTDADDLLSTLLLPPESEPAALIARAARPVSTGAAAVTVIATAEDGRQLAQETLRFAAGEGTAVARIALPSELRNRVARLQLAGEPSVGATVLLDERFRRRPVGIASGDTLDLDQPLLGDLYYLDRALAPFAEVRRGAVTDLLARQLAVLVLADIGTLTPAETDQLTRWIEAGGVLVRFAGPRLAEGADTLLPVALRRGGRAFGGVMTWGAPARLAPFDPASPFAGLVIPEDVVVGQQVLAEPAPDLGSRTWARLNDGTPLVTAEQRDNGWVILVHTTANAAWSNLALSGLYVEMLRRFVALSQGVAAAEGTLPLPPLTTLDGFAITGEPPAFAVPIPAGSFATARVTARTPPGYYGSDIARRALNLTSDIDTIAALPPLPAGVTIATYGTETQLDLKPWLLLAALLLLLGDFILALALRGQLPGFGGGRIGPRSQSGQPGAAASAIAAIIFGATIAVAPDAAAQGGPDDFAIAATNATRLAYVVTGDAAVDNVSAAGLASLSDILRRRTSLEPGEPIGVDVAATELAFFPLLYWPITAAQPTLTDATRQRLNAYMRQGGTILFDTRDQQLVALGGVGPGTLKLRELARGLDVPPLVPVPPDHVLTKAFYLLQDFPGRWAGGNIWVQQPDSRVNDGVSPFIVGGHDWAAAWATDEFGRPMFPVVPGGERQREIANRFGVNLVMYALTGNYKADQVHVPAILERLGQ